MPTTNKYVIQDGEYRRVHQQKEDGSYFIWWNKEKVPISKRRKFLTDMEIKPKRSGTSSSTRSRSSDAGTAGEKSRAKHSSETSRTRTSSIVSSDSHSQHQRESQSQIEPEHKPIVRKRRPRTNEYLTSNYKVSAHGQWRPVYQKKSSDGVSCRYYYYYNDKYNNIRNEERLVATKAKTSATPSASAIDIQPKKRVPQAVWAASKQQIQSEEEAARRDQLVREELFGSATNISSSPEISKRLPRSRGSIYFQTLLEAPYPLTPEMTTHFRFSNEETQTIWRAFKRALVRVSKGDQRNLTKNGVVELFLSYLRYYDKKPQADVEDIIAKLRRTLDYSDVSSPNYYS